LSIKLKKTKV